MRNVPPRLMYLNTWSPVSGDVGRNDGTFKRYSLAGGSTSLGAGFENL
ncbi:rCG41193 [Rattus norvegicus]|uniref:RCG41193 n=1 Tax=Rattus norvegicus TaxID=10116 RepID=A6KMS4_RAT|nr:rCG41193 [Rattus norvegicus]